MGATHNNLRRPAPGDVANCFGCLRFAGNRTPNGGTLGIPDAAITCGTGRITGMQELTTLAMGIHISVYHGRAIMKEAVRVVSTARPP